jgi:hypothetical protein
VSGKYAIVAVAAQEFFPPTARVLNLLAYVSRMHAPDLEGDWYKLTTGRAADFRLSERSSRSRALTALEARGVIEALRQPGKSPHIRFAPAVAAVFCIDVSTRQSHRSKDLNVRPSDLKS